MGVRLGVGDTECGQQLGAQLSESWMGARARARDVDWVVEDDDAVLEHDRPIGQQNGLVDIVRDKQDGGMV